ncbi:branched-chain-amino-acid aminotransferase-like protein 2 [Anneissia japonica]|uniref:branched-chain-amino-acid aminotransferase-like protein 2 n=1 Tax=Anneissia japonica TaxID=1529436 RepID=UPI00142578AF|nr:branched-chain-amino-acid aminotransferase-like protein 2 [Anneissia japonica]
MVNRRHPLANILELVNHQTKVKIKRNSFDTFWIMASGTSSPLRVIVWSAPRCMSTAFTRSIMTLDESEVLHENFAAAYFLGPERPLRLGRKGLCLAPYYTYDYVKTMFEQDVPGKKVIFAKDFPFALQGKYDKLPENYVHTFLIRNPTKVFMSIRDRYNTWFRQLYFGTEIQTYQPECHQFFEEIWKLYDHLKNKLMKPVIVIDVDDFLKDPEAMMKIYCQATGIPFRRSMLSWKPRGIRQMDWQCSSILNICAWLLGWYDNALNSNGFRKSRSPTRIPKKSMLPPDIRKAVEISEPYYKLLYDERTTV